MKWFKAACLVILLMLPLTLLAAPHEPSPAGSGWLELNPELPLVQTEKPWFSDYPGPLTIEAWIYIDRPRTPFKFNRNKVPHSIHQKKSESVWKKSNLTLADERGTLSILNSCQFFSSRPINSH